MENTFGGLRASQETFAVRSSLPVALRALSELSFSSLRSRKCEHSARAVRWCFDALSRTILRKRVETLPKKEKPKESTVESLYPGKLIFLFLRNGWAESGEKKESAKLISDEAPVRIFIKRIKTYLASDPSAGLKPNWKSHKTEAYRVGLKERRISLQFEFRKIQNILKSKWKELSASRRRKKVWREEKNQILCQRKEKSLKVAISMIILFVISITAERKWWIETIKLWLRTSDVSEVFFAAPDVLHLDLKEEHENHRKVSSEGEEENFHYDWKIPPSDTKLWSAINISHSDTHHRIETDEFVIHPIWWVCFET